MKTNKKILFIISGAIILILASILILFTNLQLNYDTIYPNVYIENNDVGGLTVESAKKLLHDKYDAKEISLKYGDKRWSFTLEELGVDMDMDKAVSKAQQVGRDGNFLSNIMKVISLNFFGDIENIKISNFEDKDVLMPKIEEIVAEIDRKPQDATIAVSGGDVSIQPGQVGYITDKTKLSEDILNAIENYRLDFDIEIKVEEVMPSVTQNDLKQINGRIAIYTTKFPNPGSPRAYNVGLAANRISNIILMPGEEMSFLETLGDISADSGYKNSTVIVNNEFVDGIGGGVCQVSSTFYNALLISGMEIVSRSNHSLPVGYTPLGRDATVATPYGPDLVFKNPYSFPVYLFNYTSGSTMISEIYGDVNSYTPTEVYSEVIETYQPMTKYVDDPTLPQGKEKIEKKGSPGYKVATYLKKNGETKRQSIDVYQRVDEIVKRGTGPDEKPYVEMTTDNENEQNTQTQDNSQSGGENISPIF